MSSFNESDFLTSINPATGETVWKGQVNCTDAIRCAVERAAAAQPEWSAVGIEARSMFLRAYAEVLGQRKQELASIISREIGKPVWEALTEVAAMIGKVELSIAAYSARCSSFSGGPSVTRFRPHGVVAVLGPYNFPGHLPNGHICPALLAGNTVLFKPSELAPATAECMLDCWQQAGLPVNVLQVLQGGRSVAEELTGHASVRGIYFTGSATTGKILAKRFADDPGKILALEMGGNNPYIIDSGNIKDLTAAALLAVQSAFLSAGQRCTCARRLIVIESPQAEPFEEELLRLTGSLRIAAPDAEPPPFMGPVASAAFVPAILDAQQSLLDSGAIALLESQSLQPGTGFISPGILQMDAVSNPPDEEIFGPILQLYRAADLDEAIKLANATRYGLASGFVSDDRSRYDYVYPRLRAGIVNWNQQLTGASSAAPFGGIGDSGNHRPSAWLAADYCAHPVASIELPACTLPDSIPHGILI